MNLYKMVLNSFNTMDGLAIFVIDPSFVTNC